MSSKPLTGEVKLTKGEARALLAALDWCECDLKLGKRQEKARGKITDAFPDLKGG